MIDLNDSKYKNCITKSHSCEENKRRFAIKASSDERKNLLRFKVDGCIYKHTQEIKSCDYIFVFKDIFTCFIELKGKDIKHAVAQLKTSLQNIRAIGKKHAFVVASKNGYPTASSQAQRWVKDFAKDHNAAFEIKNGQMGKTIEELKD